MNALVLSVQQRMHGSLQPLRGENRSTTAGRRQPPLAGALPRSPRLPMHAVRAVSRASTSVSRIAFRVRLPRAQSADSTPSSPAAAKMPPLRVVFVTGNAKKLEEVRQIIGTEHDESFILEAMKVDLPELQARPQARLRSEYNTAGSQMCRTSRHYMRLQGSCLQQLV